MSYILKDNLVVNCKLTAKGRELLSKGQLTFKKWAVGDSEIDYKFARETGFEIYSQNILRAKDVNPDIRYKIRKTPVTGDTYTEIPAVTSTLYTASQDAVERGFFTLTGSNYQLKKTTDYVLQADVRILNNTVTGGTSLYIKQGGQYGDNTAEPAVDDFVFVAWTTPYMSGSTSQMTSGVINKDVPTQFMWYKIKSVHGALSSDTLRVVVDRALPNFSTRGTNYSRCVIIPNSSGNSINAFYGSTYPSDYWSYSVVNYIQNYAVPDIDVPVWNMSIVYIENLPGVTNGYTMIDDYKSNTYNGSVKYLSSTGDSINKLAILHYTNYSPSNNYGERISPTGFKLIMPTILWHKSSTETIGLVLTANSTKKYIDNTDLAYYEIVDENGIVVGKLFSELKVITIEDQELINVLSYKSNRNYTLPAPIVGINISAC